MAAVKPKPVLVEPKAMQTELLLLCVCACARACVRLSLSLYVFVLLCVCEFVHKQEKQLLIDVRAKWELQFSLTPL